jgi:16S rRNA (cytidine1402-2'-O)-methyltransferase
MNQTGRLYIVATPIGNPDDITIRAINILKLCDAIIYEELRPASILLKKIGVIPRELIPLNEHNENELAPTILLRLLNHEKMALISDCGTPAFADPGHYLIELAAESGIPVIPVPGASSLMAALSVLAFDLKRFIYCGFLPREPENRRRELQRLNGLGMSLVLMDTPYRMGALLDDVIRVFGKGQSITLACDLTLPGEIVLRGNVGEIRNRIGTRKAEFILVINREK